MKGPRFVETNLETIWNRTYSRKQHEEKLNAIYENREQLSKFNPVPHTTDRKKIFDELRVKRQRSIKHHETSAASKNVAIMKEN